MIRDRKEIKKRPFVLVLVVCLATAYSIGQEKDIKGWRNAKWGMSEDELLSTFRGEAVRLDKISEWPDMFASIWIKDYDIAGNNYDVFFQMDKKSKLLKQVLIGGKGKREYSFEFQKLEQMLTEKYGAPSYKTSSNIATKEAWNYPSTIIELLTLHVINRFSTLSLVYHPPEGSNKI